MHVAILGVVASAVLSISVRRLSIYCSSGCGTVEAFFVRSFLCSLIDFFGEYSSSPIEIWLRELVGNRAKWVL